MQLERHTVTGRPPDVAPVILSSVTSYNETYNEPAYNINTGRPRFPLRYRHFGDLWAFASNLWLHFDCTCAETAISEVPVKLLTSPLD